MVGNLNLLKTHYYTCSDEETFNYFLILSRNSEAFASEFLGNIEKMSHWWCQW